MSSSEIIEPRRSEGLWSESELREWYERSREQGRTGGDRIGYERGRSEAETTARLLRKWAGAAVNLLLIGAVSFALYAWGVKDGANSMKEQPTGAKSHKVGATLQSFPMAAN
jgi:hypothetical protein